MRDYSPHHLRRLTLLELEARLVNRLRRRDALAIEREADEVDALQSSIDSEAESSILTQATRQLALVRLALDRLDSTTYGNCQECGDNIAARRLDAAPWAFRCVACQEDREQLRGATVRRVGMGALARSSTVAERLVEDRARDGHVFPAARTDDAA